jgi:CheY-like chemotaxis protein
MAMMRRTILILEDNDERIDGFKKAMTALGEGYALRLWHDAPTMIAQCASCFAEACLISLDYQLVRRAGGPADPGDGLEVAEFLCNQKPVCPVIIHTSAYDRRASMVNALSFAKWDVHTVVPLGPFWIRDSWVARANGLIAR